MLVDVPEIASMTLIFDLKAPSIVHGSKPEKAAVLKYLLKSSIFSSTLKINNIKNKTKLHW